MRKIWFFLSGLLVILSFIFLALWGLPLGIDFTGGSLLEVSYKEGKPAKDSMEKSILDSGIDTTVLIQENGENGYIIRMRTLNEEEHQTIYKKLSEQNKSISEERFDSIGPVIGQELKNKAVYSIFIVLIGIVIYVAWAFRKVSGTVPSWKYGVIAIIALFHDIIITIGVFSILGHYIGYEADLAFVAALLTILGYSVNDTIVVFDRIRENTLKQGTHFDFAKTVDTSVNQTIVRSINTSFTTLIALVAVYFFGGASISYFILTLMVGITIGTYSSICIASPLLVIAYRIGKK